MGCTGEPGQFPAPSPLPPFREAGVGGGGGLAGRDLPGDPERGRGVTLASQYRELESHLILARKIGRLESHLSLASYFGKSFRQALSAAYSGISTWRGFIASKFSRHLVGFQGWNQSKEKRSKLCNIPWTCYISS